MHDAIMRTTIELDDEVRAALIKRAADHGERGYSEIINQILRRHLGLEVERDREARAKRIEALAGTISPETAQRMYDSIEQSRTRWRTVS